MFKNLKQSEKILLILLLVAIIAYVFLNVYLKKHDEITSLNNNIKAAENRIFALEQGYAIANSDNAKTEQEKELDNKLLTYKNDFYIKDFSQDYLILKLNDFLGENSSAIDGFMIQKISFQKFNPKESITPEATATPDTNTTADTANTPTETPQQTEPAVPTEQPRFNVSEIDLDTLNSDAIDYLYVTLDFVSNFDGLVNYTKNIENFSKSTIIKSVIIEPVVEYASVTDLDTEGEDTSSTNGYTYIGSDGFVKEVPDSVFKENGSVKGTMEIVFIDFKVFDDNIDYHNPIFDEDIPSTVDNPFKPYDNFTHYNEPTVSNENSYNSSGEYITTNVTYNTIYDFETNQIFFSSSPADTKGTATLSPLPYKGNSSGKLIYNFIKGLETGTASYVFDANNILITEKPSSLSLKVYELTSFPYDLGVTIKDSSGATYNVILSETGEDQYSAWKTYESELPELTYPCIVKRIFVTTEGYEKTQLQGELLFDELQVSKSIQ